MFGPNTQTPLLASDAPVTFLGAGAADAAGLGAALALAPRLVAADGGAGRALGWGATPDLVIGDLDSLDPATAARLGDRVHHLRDQDSTDFEKCLARVAAPLVIGLGFLGDRLDHSLASLSALLGAGRPVVLATGAREICFLAP
ncbi:MAG: thiamine pyrophosphokinase, partial [Shimia sp.]